MKKLLLLVSILICASVAMRAEETASSSKQGVASGAPTEAMRALPAFPGAQGFGALATGGRGGEIYHVTNLNDDGAGSLRDAVSKPRRTVVFDVGGVIRIKSRLQVASDITLAGQTAPGDGITVYGERVAFSSNSIIRYMRFRGSIDMPRGGCTVILDDLKNTILDHVSISWGRWDNLHIKGSSDVTLQWCIIAEGIDPQMFGALIERPDNITIHHCLWSNNQSRNPKGKAKIQYINNVVYNWKVGGFVGGHSALKYYQDLINNYFVAGPDSDGNKFVAMFFPTDNVYHSGNYVDLDKDGALNGRPVTDGDFTRFEPAERPTLLQKPTNTPPVAVTMDDAAGAFEKVLARAGASLKRDSVDARQVEHARSLGKKGAIIKSEADVGGQPEMKSGSGGAFKDVPDALKITASGYTNLEVYLNSLVPAE